MQRTRPLPPDSHRGVFPLVISAGIILGVAAVFWIPQFEMLYRARSTGNWAFYGKWWFHAGCLIAPVFIVAPLVSYFVASRWRAVSACLVFAIFLVLARDVTEAMIGIDGGLYCRGFWMQDLARRLPRLLAIALVAGVAALGLTQLIWGAPQVVHGRCCRRCFYDLGSEAVVACPECGEPFDPARSVRSRGFRLWRRLARAAPTVLVVVTVAAAASIGHRIVTCTWPTERFLRAIDPSGTRALVLLLFPAVTDPSKPPQTWTYRESIAAWQPIEDRADWCVAYAVLPGRHHDLPAMRIQLAFVPSNRYESATRYWGGPDTGYPPIFADLSAGQAESVIQAGQAPPELVRLLVRTGVERGFSSRGEGTVANIRSAAIDATRFFPTSEPANTGP